MMRYTPEHRETALPLGGIGTGCVSLGARGEWRDWELFNRPGKGNTLPCTFLCLWYRPQGEAAAIRVLESRIRPPYGGPNGWRSGRSEFPGEMGGLPRFADSVMTVDWPFATVSLIDDDLPVAVSLDVFNPFIPLNSLDSSLPCALYTIRISNRTHKQVAVSVTGSLLNPVGYDGLAIRPEQLAGNRSRFLTTDGLNGLFLDKAGDPTAGSLALLTDQAATAKREWIKGEWWDGVQEFWEDLLADGRLEAPQSSGLGSDLKAPELTIGSLAVPLDLAPGATVSVRLVLCWHFPNRPRGWWPTGDAQATVRNHYAVRFADAWAVGCYALRHFDRLSRDSRRFSKALGRTTLPPVLRDAALRNLAVLRSPTLFRLEDGLLLGWEGCLDRQGSCHGSCTHVYNYAQSTAALFPELERAVRAVEFGQELDERGAMAFRLQTPFGWPRSSFSPAIDGQFGTIVRLARDWKLCGDSDWLRSLWPQVRRALDFGLAYWDPDADGLPEAKQHNTYDVEFYGPNPLGASMMLAALTAGVRMAEALGDDTAASRWHDRLALGRQAMATRLFNGSYYRQLIDPAVAARYQTGEGCLADQLTGQFLADCAGLGDLLDPDQILTALQAIVQNNTVRDFTRLAALHRTYALNDERGLLLCTWPHGGRPTQPLPYADEVWTGVEYAVAALLLRRGRTDLAIDLVAAIADRHDGIRRNPFNEAECGHHYARSMASWGLVLAWAGADCDLPRGRICFNPAFAGDGCAFFSCARAWGLLIAEQGRWRLELLSGNLDGIAVLVNSQVIPVGIRSDENGSD